ncbi:FmdE family protein [uncultured Desulfosarcina sp.]|uniref:FmdE family protein n=1 Tax=uncultured Desulfosarcina sp. TaxID=218289 RepID=UPI0029C8B047|nr:FmdE family protein [uncultured Desulfosarcina sp.]
MQKIAGITAVVVLMLAIVSSGCVCAAPFDETVSQAMQTLDVSKGDPGLLVLTDAPYVKVDGECALPWLAKAQEKTGCTVGRGNLLFFQRTQDHPFRLMLFRKKDGDAVILSRMENRWITDTLNIGPSAISRPAFWEKIDRYQAGRDLFSLAAMANAWAKGAPYDFLKSAELHNHICPGLTSGYLMAHYIIDHFPLEQGERYIVVACPVWCKEDAFQVVMDCTAGKKGLIVKPLSDDQKKQIVIANPAGMILVWDAEKKTGRGAALSFNFDPLRALSSKDTPKAAMVLAAVDHLDHPDRFVSMAAEFQLDEELYEAITQAGGNPWEATGLVKK